MFNVRSKTINALATVVGALLVVVIVQRYFELSPLLTCIAAILSTAYIGGLAAILGTLGRLKSKSKRLDSEERRSCTAIEKAPVGIIVIDQRGQIVIVNEHAAEIFGYPSDALKGSQIEVLVPAKIAKSHIKMRDLFFEHAAEQRPMAMHRDIVGMRKDGTPVQVQINLALIRVDDSKFAVASVLDVSERKAKEQKATSTLEEKVQRLDEVNADLDHLVFSASHDLQEPIRKIVSFSQLLEKDIKDHFGCDSLSETIEQDLEILVDAAMRMKDLVQSLLDLSKTKSELQTNHFNIRDAIDTALQLLAPEIVSNKATISVKVDNATIDGDQTLIQQVYQNLLINAMKFCKKEDENSPEITLTHETDPSGKHIFGVKDNGIGISPDYHRTIFSPFKRLNSRRQYQGSGIGLSICKSIIEKHNGEIWVESIPGAGAHFKFSLPPLSQVNSEKNNDE